MITRVEPEVPGKDQRICNLTLDEKSILRRSPDVEHERAVAVYDLLEHNCFAPSADLVNGDGGPYNLHILIEEDRLVFDIRDEGNKPLGVVGLSLKPFAKLVKDYFIICESYFSAIKTASPSRIEALDMGRRGIHTEGSEILRQRLSGKIEIDLDTARRLFTLVCVLHIKA